MTKDEGRRKKILGLWCKCGSVYEIIVTALCNNFGPDAAVGDGEVV